MSASPNKEWTLVKVKGLDGVEHYCLIPDPQLTVQGGINYKRFEAIVASLKHLMKE